MTPENRTYPDHAPIVDETFDDLDTDVDVADTVATTLTPRMLQRLIDHGALLIHADDPTARPHYIRVREPPEQLELDDNSWVQFSDYDAREE